MLETNTNQPGLVIEGTLEEESSSEVFGPRPPWPTSTRQRALRGKLRFTGLQRKIPVSKR